MNRMSAKAKQTLLVGGRKKTAAERVLLKHDPLTEYRDSMEMFAPKVMGRKLHEAGVVDRDVPTMLGLRVVAFKAALCTAALETAGITKTSARRLLFIPGDLVPLYGTPQLRMDVVRSADINRTPDVRTRAFLPQWGAEIEVQHVLPQLPPHSVVTLACNAGMLVGIGDFRQEKGKGAFGSFRVLAEGQQDDEWDDLVANHAATSQRKAIDEPDLADDDTRDLMEYFHGEQKKRAA
jgi:hypothetical protein